MKKIKVKRGLSIAIVGVVVASILIPLLPISEKGEAYVELTHIDTTDGSEVANYISEGHIQGITTDFKYLYWGATADIIKTNLTGSVICNISVTSHSGDIGYANGKIYAPYSGGSIKEYYASNLTFITEHSLSNLTGWNGTAWRNYFPGGIEYWNGYYYIAGGQSYDRNYPVIFKYDMDFNYVTQYNIPCYCLQAAQGIGRAHGYWWVLTYDTANETIRCDNDFNIVEVHDFSRPFGFVEWDCDTVLTGRCTNIYWEDIFISPKWWNLSWNYRQKITFDNSNSEVLIDFPILVHLNSSNFNFSHANANGSDIRFIGDCDTTELNYEIESWNTTEANIWVNVLKIDNSSSDSIYMYYGNTSMSDNQNMTGTWNSDYRMVQHLQEYNATDSAIHNDSTSYGNNGTPYNFDKSNATQNASGYIDGANLFNKSDQTYVDCGSNESLKFGSGSFSVFLRVKFNAKVINQYLITGKLVGSSRWNIYVGGGNTLHMFIIDSVGTSFSRSIGAYTTDVWYHLGFVRDTSTGKVYIYQNGTWLSTTDDTTDDVTSQGIYLGCYGPGTHHINGTLDEVQVSAVARSSNWINAAYRNEIGTLTIFGEEQMQIDDIYVDDDADSSWYDINHVKTIQEGIDNTTTGNPSVWIWGGLYTENINVNKSVKIIGNGTDKVTVTVANSSKNVFTIVSSNVDISGLKIVNASTTSGIYVDSANYFNADNIDIPSGYYGIFLNDVDYAIINNCNCSNIYRGIKMVRADHCRIKNNILNSNTESGILFDYSNDNNMIENNTINNNRYGVLFYNKNQDNIIRNNTIKSNSYGMRLYKYGGSPSINNLIYNNYFNNTVNARDDGNNTWNITKTTATNIIGKPYQGGNYWYNYIGEDTNGDYLGDTNLPYNFAKHIQNGGDYLPLMPDHTTVGEILRIWTQNVTSNSITIMWETNGDISDNRVEYGETSEYGYTNYSNKIGIWHNITIYPNFDTGHFKIHSTGIESNDHTFNLLTTDPNSFQFVIFGDSRGTWDNWANGTKVANAVNNEDISFAIFSGDMVANGDMLDQWHSWLDLMSPIMQNISIYGVKGNHELPDLYYNEIFNPQSYYSFDYAECHFIILDNYENYTEGSAQYEWLENDLNSTDKWFKIVIQHEGMYVSGGHDSNMDLRNAFETLFNQYNVDVVFSGHNHFYQRSKEINGTTYITSAGAGAPLYSPSPTPASFVDKSEEAYHYCLVTFSSSDFSLKITAKHTNGTIFDEHTIYYTPTIGERLINILYAFIPIILTIILVVAIIGMATRFGKGK